MKHACFGTGSDQKNLVALNLFLKRLLRLQIWKMHFPNFYLASKLPFFSDFIAYVTRLVGSYSAFCLTVSRHIFSP